MNLNSQTRRNPAQRNEHGYIMLTLLLAMALMAIFAAVIVPSITFEIKRDREEEMIHRGVQYSRAIRAYYKKFGRYPTKIEDLENTNNHAVSAQALQRSAELQERKVRGLQAAALRRSADVAQRDWRRRRSRARVPSAGVSAD